MIKHIEAHHKTGKRVFSYRLLIVGKYSDRIFENILRTVLAGSFLSLGNNNTRATST